MALLCSSSSSPAQQRLPPELLLRQGSRPQEQRPFPEPRQLREEPGRDPLPSPPLPAGYLCSGRDPEKAKPQAGLSCGYRDTAAGAALVQPQPPRERRERARLSRDSSALGHSPAGNPDPP